jgi:hypothetical protein
MTLILGSQPKLKHEKENKTRECKEESPTLLHGFSFWKLKSCTLHHKGAIMLIGAKAIVTTT